MLNANIELIPKCKRLMVVGTNCQIKGMEVLLKHKCDTLIKVCIFASNKRHWILRVLGKNDGSEN